MSTEQQTRTVHFFDVDGVIANDTHRVEHALANPPRWAQYFMPSAVAADGVWIQGLDKIREAAARGEQFFYLTGRRWDLIRTTQTWMLQKYIPVSEIFGRPMQRPVAFGQPVPPRPPLANFKADFLEKYEADHPGVRTVLYDDDPEVVRLVRERLGREDAAVHCTWHTKQSSLVKKAVA